MKLFLRAASTLTVGLALVLAATVPSGASPTATDDSKSAQAARTSSVAAACPVSGQRVKTSTSDRVYVIDPQGFINWVPLASYNGLWDNFNNIDTYNNLFTECYSTGDVFTMNGAHLAKTSNNPAVYIWDSAIVVGGAFRWITSPAIFAKYRFSSSKILTLTSISPITNDFPWNN